MRPGYGSESPPLQPLSGSEDGEISFGLDEDGEISFGLDEENGELLVNQTEISDGDLFRRTSSTLAQGIVSRDTECDNVSCEHSESPTTRNGALVEIKACNTANQDRPESEPPSEEDVELDLGARSVSTAEDGLLSRESLSATPSLQIQESPETDSRITPSREPSPLSYSPPLQPPLSYSPPLRDQTPSGDSHKSTVTVAAISSSRAENFSVQNLSSSSNHSQERDSDSDVSFNQDPIIKHQAKQTIQL